jgi:hypothetical protein
MQRFPNSVHSPRLLSLALAGSAALAACGAPFTSSEGTGASGSSSLGGSAGSMATAPAAGATSSDAGSGDALPQGGAPTLPVGGGGSLSIGGSGGIDVAGGTGARAVAGEGGISAGKGGIGAAGGSWSPCSPASIVDDMEDGNDRNCPNQGRNGEWWASTGTLTGTIDPAKAGEFPAYALLTDARFRSNYGMHLSGTGFGHTASDWASLGFNLIDDAAYDLTAYQGLSFYAKSKAGPLTIHVEFATDATTPTAEGGACQAKCNDHWEKALTLDGSWQEFSVPFATLAQEGWGVQVKDLAHTRFIYFGFAGTDGGPAAFDFLIDDVRLY